MKIHEYQAKEILEKFDIPIQRGYTLENKEDINLIIKKVQEEFETEAVIVKAQIHAGGRGKAGGVKILNNIDELIKESKELLGKKLITPQTGPNEKEVKRLYVEEISNLKKHYSGHLYFSLKDEDSVISSVCWKSNVLNLKIQLLHTLLL